MNFKNSYIQFIFFCYEFYLNCYIYLLNIFNYYNYNYKYYVNYFYLYDNNLSGVYYKLNLDKNDWNDFNTSNNSDHLSINKPNYLIKTIGSSVSTSNKYKYNELQRELLYYDSIDKFEFKLISNNIDSRYTNNLNIVHSLNDEKITYELILKDIHSNNRYSNTEYYKPYLLKLPPFYNIFKLNILFKFGLQSYINICIPTFYRIIDIDRYNLKGIYLFVYEINGIIIKKSVLYKPNRRFLL